MASIRERPSEDADKLSRQLAEELARIASGQGDEPFYRPYLRTFLLRAWKDVSTGDRDAPRRWRDALLSSLGFAERTRLPKANLRQMAAAELVAVCDALEIGQRAVELSDSERVLLEKRPNKNKVTILRVLVQSSDRYLRRRQVHALAKQAGATFSEQYTGQVLAEFLKDRIVLCTLHKAQGASQAAHYRVSPLGLRIHDDLRPAIVNPPPFETANDYLYEPPVLQTAA